MYDFSGYSIYQWSGGPAINPRSSHTKWYLLNIQHAGHCWRSRDELTRDVLLWIPTHGRAKARRPAQTYIQQLCEDKGCCPEDLPRAMNDGEEWRERVRDIRASSAIWWSWWTRIKWSKPGKIVVPSSIPRCRIYRKRGLRITLDNGLQMLNFNFQILHSIYLSIYLSIPTPPLG